MGGCRGGDGGGSDGLIGEGIEVERLRFVRSTRR